MVAGIFHAERRGRRPLQIFHIRRADNIRPYTAFRFHNVPIFLYTITKFAHMS